MARKKYTAVCPLCSKKTTVGSELDAEFIEENGCDECSNGASDEVYEESEEEEEGLFESYDDELQEEW